jgi:hypothetical protein
MAADLPVTSALRKKVLRVLFISLLLDLVSLGAFGYIVRMLTRNAQ